MELSVGTVNNIIIDTPSYKGWVCVPPKSVWSLHCFEQCVHKLFVCLFDVNGF